MKLHWQKWFFVFAYDAIALENLRFFGSERSAFSQICGLAAMILPAL
jgi:hypothetical protein